MIAYRYTIIAKEGWLPVTIVMTGAILLQMEVGWKAALGVWVLAALMLYLYRDPPRKVPSSPLGIVSPIDGVVVAVRQGAGPYLERQAIAITIKATSSGVFSIRSPTEGKVMEQWCGLPPNDSELVSDTDKAQRQFSQWVKTDEDDDVVFVLKPKLRIGKFRCSVTSGGRIGQGQRFSFLLFGADTDVLIPETSHLSVKAGDRVRAGETIIASLVH